jgi:hypothetical protein
MLSAMGLLFSRRHIAGRLCCDLIVGAYQRHSDVTQAPISGILGFTARPVKAEACLFYGESAEFPHKKYLQEPINNNMFKSA